MKNREGLSRLLSEHGMLLVLLGVCAYFSVATYGPQQPNGPADGERLAEVIVQAKGPKVKVLIAVRATEEDALFAEAMAARLRSRGAAEVAIVRGQPSDFRAALESSAATGGLDAIAANQATASLPVLQGVGQRFPGLGAVQVFVPPSYRWPTFLMPGNLLNIANQIAVIAILAIGMTMVIIVRGIDLSVGSLIALSAVTAMLLIRDAAGGENAAGMGMAVCCLAAIGLCAGIGLFNGLLVTVCQVPPFIATLSMMLVCRGLALRLSQAQSIAQAPESFTWLGRGADLLGVPNAVVLMAFLYLVAHLVMARTVLGRRLYAVGGNPEAARFSGIHVNAVLIVAYTICGTMAGLGGTIMASQLKSGAPTYGQMYELYVIAAVVVGGTSLRGGEGKVLGTLVGALLIAVINNGMNLTGVESSNQLMVLGLVILAAVLVDGARKKTWRLPWSSRRALQEGAIQK